MEKRKTGTREWATETANCFLGCEHDCRYCYARAMALRTGRLRARDNWSKPVPNHAALSKRWGKHGGVIMFPSTHDITPANVMDCGGFLAEILKPGNRVLIVSKPHAGVVDYLCKLLARWGEQVEFRFTIGARDDALLRYWEPSAPGFDERMNAAEMADGHGYNVSFSVEPMLDSADILGLVAEMTPFAETIWIGKMNQVRRRVQIYDDEDRRQVERIEQGQTDERIMEVVAALESDPLIRWKDSIQEVIERTKR